MDAKIAEALRSDKVIDITTSGRRTGQPRRIEIWFHNLNGHLYLSGMPGSRDWYANLVANPDFTFHLKESVHADLSATAVAVTDPEQKSRIIGQLFPDTLAKGDLQHWVEKSPLIEIKLNLA